MSHIVIVECKKFQRFYGPFDDKSAADTWARANIEFGFKWHSEPLNPTDEAIPSYGVLMTLDEFMLDVRSRLITDQEGYGKYATATKMSRKIVGASDVYADHIDESFTHVVWFSK
jgi:hypothetical protein